MTVQMEEFVFSPEEEQRRRDEEAREAARAALSSLQAPELRDATRSALPSQAFTTQPSDWATSDLPDIGPPPSDVSGPAPSMPEPARESFSPPTPPAPVQAPQAPQGRMGRDLGAPQMPQAPALERAPQVANLGRALSAPSTEALPTDMRARMLAAIAKSRQQKPAQAPQAQRPDYTGVDTADAFRRVLHAIGSGLRSASGRSPTPFRSLGEEARTRDAQQALRDQRAAQQASAQRMQGERLGLDRERLDAQVQNMAAQRDAQRSNAESLARYRQDQTDIRRSQAESRVGADQALAEERRGRAQLLGSQAQEAADEQARRVALREVDSPETNHLRSEVMAEISSIPRLRADLERSGVLDWLATARGEEIERYAARNGISIRSRGYLARGRAGGVGLTDPQAAQTLEMPPPGWSGTPEGWRALTRRQRQQQIAALGRRPDRSQDPNTRDLAVRTSAADEALRELEEAMPPEGEDVPGFGRVDSLRGRSIVQSEEGIRLRTLAENAMRRFLRLESGATIGDEEMAREMDLRGMGLGASEQQLRNGIRDLRRDLDARMRTLTRGLQDPDSGEQAQQPSQGAGRHRYELPGGRRVVGPAGGLDALRARYGDQVRDLGPVEGGG